MVLWWIDRLSGSLEVQLDRSLARTWVERRVRRAPKPRAKLAKIASTWPHCMAGVCWGQGEWVWRWCGVHWMVWGCWTGKGTTHFMEKRSNGKTCRSQMQCFSTSQEVWSKEGRSPLGSLTTRKDYKCHHCFQLQVPKRWSISKCEWCRETEVYQLGTRWFSLWFLQLSATSMFPLGSQSGLS